MKLFPPRNHDAIEYVGRSLDEAVRRARRELGEEAPVRCWKVRRGGLLGFFAHEYYVAGLTPPAGSLASGDLTAASVGGSRSGEALGEFDSRYDELSEFDVDRCELERGWEASPDVAGVAALDDLVAATNDELALSSDEAARRAFGEVLAQAEALLMRSEPADASHATYTRPEHSPLLATGELALRERLADLGVPEEYLPGSQEGFDALWSRLQRLARAPALRAGAGEVLVVIGSHRDARATATALVRHCALAERDVIDAEPSVELRRRLQRRRRGTRASVVIVDAPVGASVSPELRRWLAQLGAARVIGALGAHAKRAEVRRWLDDLEVVDSLACWRLGEAGAVADLMGVAPICLLEGNVASPMRWLALLSGALGRVEP